LAKTLFLTFAVQRRIMKFILPSKVSHTPFFNHQRMASAAAAAAALPAVNSEKINNLSDQRRGSAINSGPQILYTSV
jgi:hypothetical protein